MSLDRCEVEERYKKVEDLLSEDSVAEDMLSDLEDSVLKYRSIVNDYDTTRQKLKSSSSTGSDYRSGLEEVDKTRTASHNGLINNFYPVNRIVIRKAKGHGRLDEFIGGLYTGEPLDISKDNPRHRDAIRLWSEVIEDHILNKHSEDIYGAD